MHRPEMYERRNHANSLYLDKVGDRIQWKRDHLDTILDVGCGPGNTLIEVVLPRFKGKYAQVYATDVSEEMVQYASRKYAVVQDVKFLQMNITNVDEFLSRYGPVDHVVSSFVLHWISDQDQALRNILKLLKPGGDFLSVHVRNCTMFDLYSWLHENERWNKYWDNLKQFVPESHHSREPEKELRERMQRCGFTDVFVDFNTNDIDQLDLAGVKDILMSIMAQNRNVPEAEREEFWTEVLDFAFENKLVTVHPSGEMSFRMDSFIVYGRKSEIK